MEILKLYIELKKYTGESAVVSIRIPRDMIQAFDDIAATTGRSRSEVMTMGLEFARRHMEIVQNKEGD